VEASYWEAASNRRFLSVFIVLLALLLGLAAVSVLTGTWWATGVAVLYSLALPIQYYTNARAKHKSLAGFAVLSVFLMPLLFVVNFYGLKWTPYPLSLLAILELLLSVFFAGGLVTLLCERFLKPRLKPKPVPTGRH
jgi:hypothetical protein